MTLSVVVPAYNASDTLATTLDSLLAQTRGDWQAVIVDDGSTDATRRIAQDYVARDARFSLLAHDGPPKGVAAARNLGIAAATGRFVSFLDSDDTIEPAYVAKLVGRLEAHPGAKVAYCGSRRITATGQPGVAWFSTDIARAPFETLARYFPMVVHGAVLDRALVVEQGGFDESLRIAEDMDFYQRIARTGVAFLPVPEPLALYRMRAGSLSTDAGAQRADGTRVIERGFDCDPRVARPAPRHAAGADPTRGSLAMALGINALWCAAIDLGQGGDGIGLLMPLPDRRSDLPELCRQTIVEGLGFGAQRLPRDLPHDDPAFVARVTALLLEIERAAGRPGLAQHLRFALEPEIFSPGHLTERLTLDRTLLVRQDLAHLQPVVIEPGIDRLHVEFRSDGQVVGHIEAPALGGFSRRDVVQLALDSVSLARLLRDGGLLSRPAFWLHAATAATQIGLTVLAAKAQRRAVPVRSLRALAKAALGDAALAVAGDTATAARELDALIAEGRAMAGRTVAAGQPVAKAAEPKRGHDRRAYWEGIYRTEDPWDYASPYEQLKYRRTLDLLPAAPVGKAMELACAEGRFTALLAPRVGRLIAADISQTALARAQQRCAGAGNIDYRRLDLADDALPSDLDLIVCSEVLYFLADKAALEHVAARLAASLVPGGHLLSAHAFVLEDDPGRTGFDWGTGFGARVIAETMAATPGLTLERSLRTDLYRIDLFRRLREGEVAATPILEEAERGPLPGPDHARYIVWDGAVARRAELRARETTDRLAILLYHRVAEDGPADLARYRQSPVAFAEQMRWLRRNGYHSVTSEEVQQHLASGRPFEGRPILISFDDAYRDFHDVAWPILQAHDFTAEVFVVTDRVGGRADWDADYGPPAELMDWAQLQTLAAAGVRFGSHMASHSHMADLSSREIVLEAARSQAALERALATPCRSIAAPFGEGDERFVRIARQCGYRTGFTTDPGFATLGLDPLRLPRVEVVGGWSIDTFVEAIQVR